VRKSIAVAVALVAGFLAGGRPALAADARTEKAREHYLQGDAFYKLDKYPQALAEYEQAYLAKPDPSFLYNIAQCHRLMGNRAEAVRFYRRYLKDAPHAPNREVADKHIKDLEAALVADPTPAPGGRPGGMPPPTPTPAPGASPDSAAFPPPSAGANSGNPGTLALSAAPPAPADGSFVVGPASGVPPSSDESNPIYTKWWFWTGIGAVVGGGILVLLLVNRDPACPAGRTCS
jgi:tetratricopeptide (TPR) repeat protein